MSKGFLQSLGSRKQFLILKKVLTHSLVSQADSNLVSPLELARNKGSNPIASRQLQASISVNKVPTKGTQQMNSDKKLHYLHLQQDSSGHNNSNFRGSPQRETDEYGRMAFTMKVITGSGILMELYNEYEKEEKGKETYNNEIKKYEANTKSSFVDLYDLGDHEKLGSMSETHMVITHTPHKPQMWLHLLLNYKTFSSLSVRKHLLNKAYIEMIDIELKRMWNT